MTTAPSSPARRWIYGLITTTSHTRRWMTARRRSSRGSAAEEKTAAKPPWKTLRVSHFPSARRRLGQAPCLRHSLELQYAQTSPSTRAKPNHAGRDFQSPLVQFSGAGQRNFATDDGRTEFMEDHMKNMAENRRVHYLFEPSRRVMVIGYFGEHLETAGKASISTITNCRDLQVCRRVRQGHLWYRGLA